MSRVSFKLFKMFAHLLNQYNRYIHTRPVQKVSHLRPGEKSCVPGGAQFLIPFKVGLLWLHTLSPTFLPLLEAFLEGFSALLSRSAWCPCGCQNGNPSVASSIWGTTKIIRSHVWKVASLANNWNAVFGQETLDQVWWMSWALFRISGSLLAKCNATSTYYSTSHTNCLGEKDAPDQGTKNHACAWRSPPPLWSDFPTCCHWFFREKIKSDTFWTGLTLVIMLSLKLVIKGTVKEAWGNHKRII
jgi:hypothetical protein